MELIDIIVQSLKLFALVSFIVLVISYTVFKIKDRNRIKPYMIPASPQERVAVEQVLRENTNIHVEDFVPAPALQKKNERIKIVNKKVPAKLKRESFGEPAKLFKVDVSSLKETISEKLEKKEAELQTHESESFNDIYSLYNNNKLTPMHKLKLQSS